MAYIVAIASGKGGVGKSFLSSCMAMTLHGRSHSTLLVDADLGGANLHNFIGCKIPSRGLYNFFRERRQIEEIISTGPTGLNYIAGAGDILGIAHITKVERIRFIDKLRAAPYEYIIVDLGAGTTYNTVDLFNEADMKVVALSSEPTSIENAYGFIKVALYRYLEKFISADPDFSVIDKKLRSKSASYPNVDIIINDLAQINREAAGFIQEFVRHYTVNIILNMVRFKKELNIFYGFESIIKKYLSIQVEKLGFMPYDERVGESIKMGQSFYEQYKDSGTVSCIQDICDTLLSKI